MKILSQRLLLNQRTLKTRSALLVSFAFVSYKVTVFIKNKVVAKYTVHQVEFFKYRILLNLAQPLSTTTVVEAEEDGDVIITDGKYCIFTLHNNSRCLTDVPYLI